MLFSEPVFFLFFAILFAVYWTLKNNKAQQVVLLIASYIFYGSWDWRFLFLIIGSSIANFLFGRQVQETRDPRLRRILMASAVALNIGLLGLFKYYNFFLDSVSGIGSFLGSDVSFTPLNVILPIGISFYTFESLIYVIDIYRGKEKAHSSLFRYCLFIGFFPKLVAGPIVRPDDFLPQLEQRRVLPRGAALRALLILFLIGFLKKSCISDNIAPFVDQVFGNADAYSATASIIAVWLYAVQIYCDFSGYSDMAIAIAGLLGFRLVLNFDAPYLSTSIQDFWRRWHISLSNWLRDYLYVSLGGRSDNPLITYRNLFLTMLIGGLWHGAAWTFVVWGGLHGLALIVQRIWRRLPVPSLNSPALATALSWFVTIQFVCATWIFFRAPDFGTAMTLLGRYLLIDPGGSQQLPLWLGILPLALLGIQYLSRHGAWLARGALLERRAFTASYVAAWSFLIAMLPFSYRPFIYFQF